MSADFDSDRINYVRDSSLAGPYFHESGGIVDTAFSPDGKYVASIGTDGLCLIWDSASAKSLHSIPTRLHGRILAIGWQGIQEKSLLAIGGEDGRLEIWDMSGVGVPSKPVFEVQAHSAPLVGIQFDPLSEQLLTWDGSLNDNTPSRIEGSSADQTWEAWQATSQRTEAASIPSNQPAIWSLSNAIRQSTDR